MLGKPVIKGTRLPASIIVEKVAHGATVKEIVEQYPFLENEDVRAALLYAAQVMKMDNVYAV